MKLTIEQGAAAPAVLRIDGRMFCYCMGHEYLGDDKTYSVILKSEMGDLAPFIVGTAMVITDEPGEGLQLGKIAGDDFVLDGRACLATLINQMRDAVDNLEKITLEIV
jgi:hypothetical protein